MTTVQTGDFVRLRGRRWLVEGERDLGEGLTTLNLACVDDDAQGERADIVWSAELDAERLGDEGWEALARTGTDDPAVFSAYIRTLQWGTATATDLRLFQAPFRAGIRLDAYQLLPLWKALRLPRVNLLIADDVGAGKTVEAGLVLREMLLRRRVDFAVVAAPAGMVRQWQDELEAKFGLTFTIVDREHLAQLRRERGFAANPWTAGSFFIISHSLLTDDTYAGGLRDALGSFRSKAILILDEAHHAAPASGARYAVDSQFTRAVRGLAACFEHRLFLSATPHNGHSNSFSSLLEILDPQRFTRAVPVRPRELDAVMVRRLKSDLRHFGERFPKRTVEPVILRDLPEDAPDLLLPRMLAAYGEGLRTRAETLPAREAGLARLAFVGLQQRLLSSAQAFADTLAIHINGLKRRTASAAVAAAFVHGAAEVEEAETEDGAGMNDVLEKEEMRRAEAAASFAAPVADLAAAQAMLDLALKAARRPDARVTWLANWIRAQMAPNGRWNTRRLVIFTEYEATRRWLERRLMEALDDLAPEDRLAHFTGATPLDEREELKRRFNADPATDPLRILLCTDAAREGINLQTRCHDLIHFDLPWNPARLEQRNGRIDRKLQPAEEVFCRYFVYAQRPEDVVLQALVRKTELIRDQLGSAGQVIAARLADKLARNGIVAAQSLAQEVETAGDDPLVHQANEEMDDDTQRRRARQAREIDELRKHLEQSRERVGVDPEQLSAVVATALSRAGVPLGQPTGSVEGTPVFQLDASNPAFSTAGWPEALDTLRARRRTRADKSTKDWRAAAPLRALSFRPAITAEGADAEGVVQLHLEHRLVRRLLGRFLSQGFQSGLSRACVVVGPGAQPRVVLIGRLALYGPGAARLHEEMITVTAPWTEAGRGTTPLKPFATRGEEATMVQVEKALRDPRRPPAVAIDRVRSWAAKDAADLEPVLRTRAEAARREAAAALTERGIKEAEDLRALIAGQRSRVATAVDAPEDTQLSLFGDQEAAQRRRDREHWRRKLVELDGQLVTEPDRVRASYDIRADRLEIVGLLYLWPASN
ncbi:DISARM system SNF2-like helicase DrmD [Nitrospirillum bahiense]|uniref:SNF2 domain-containing protein n=1 Tax=Nitrospirillum amazonense TaxID=28077 RepID=A0A560FVG5_9PROT|nr:DISARM system SNF2-like helicase DrmD [Nitrospirillum amazonense]TWB25636.1 SNF2 domain-containing protein [Nitrospirillum amazonense]